MRFPILVIFVAACSGGSSNPDAEQLELLLDEVSTQCGTVEFSNLDPVCPDVTAAIACFESADRPHIAQISQTVEGDSIYEHFLVDNGVAVHIRDTREDTFGTQEVTRTECTAVQIFEGNGCARIICAE